MKTMVKKVTASVLMIVMLFALVSCGASDNKDNSDKNANTTTTEANTTSENTGKTSDEKITMRFSWWGADTRHQATLAAMDIYMDRHPNVTLEGEYGAFDSAYEKLLTQIAGNTAPDIVSVDYQWTFELMKKKAPFVNMYTLQDKIDMANTNIDFAKSYGGDDEYLIGLPVGMNGLGYMYNDAFLKKYNITPSDKWSWDDIITYGKKVHEQDSSKYLLYNILNHWVYLVKAQVKQMNNNPLIKDDFTFGFSKEDMTKVFSYIRKLVDTGTVPSFEEGVLYDNVYADANPEWLNQNIGVFPTSSSHLPAALKASEFDISSIRYPGVEGAADSGILVTPAVYLCVYEKSKYVDQAADFIDFFLNDEEAIKVLKDTRSVPVNKKAQELLVEEGILSDTLVNFLDQAMTAPGLPDNSPSLNSEVLAVLKDYIQQVGYKQMTPEKAAEEMMKELEPVLASLK